MTDSIVAADREAVLEAVRRTLRLVGPDLGIDDTAQGYPGDAGEIFDKMNSLIEISRRTTAEMIEPYLAQIFDDICVKCPHQFNSGYCPLRETCALQKCAVPVFEAIGGALRNQGDREYCQTHDDPTRKIRPCNCGGGCPCGRNGPAEGADGTEDGVEACCI